MIVEEERTWAGRHLTRAVGLLVGAGVVLGGGWLLWVGAGYYLLDAGAQALHPLDARLRSGGPIGLRLGLLAAALMGLNVLYLLRRTFQDHLRFLGTPRSWMTVHVATGIAAPIVALLHSGFTLRTPLGAAALLLLAAASLIGVVGRYLYSVVPRGATGRELQLSQVRARADLLLREVDGRLGAHRGAAAEAVRAALDAPLRARRARWVGGWLLALALGDLERWRRVRALGRQVGPAGRPLLPLVERALRLRVQAERHQVLNDLMGTWRAAHRWLALCTSLLLLGHVYVAITYARLTLG